MPHFGHSSSLPKIPFGVNDLAEGMGFEPMEPFRAQHISSVLLSTTQPPFHWFAITLVTATIYLFAHL